MFFTTTPYPFAVQCTLIVNVMADNVDEDVCSYNGKSNSSSANCLKQIDLIQSNQQQQHHHHEHSHHHPHHHQHRHHKHQHQLEDAEHINNAISITSNVSAHFQLIFLVKSAICYRIVDDVVFCLLPSHLDLQKRKWKKKHNIYNHPLQGLGFSRSRQG